MNQEPAQESFKRENQQVWFSEFFAQHGRVPTAQEIEEWERKRLRQIERY